MKINRIKEYHIQQRKLEDRRYIDLVQEKRILEERRKEKIRRMDKHRVDVYA